MAKSFYAFIFALTACSLVELNAQIVVAPGNKEEEEEQIVRFVQRREIFTNTELLVWTLQETPLDYAIRTDVSSADTTPAITKGRYKTATFDWAPGFRLALGWYNQPRYWEIMWQYTQLFTSGSNHGEKPETTNNYIQPTWDIQSPTPLKKAKSHISFHYHVADMLVSRVFDTNPHLRMRLIAGLTTSWMNQMWKIRYFNFNQNEEIIKNHWQYWGTGFRTGLSADWFWSGHFYFIGRLTFATLVGGYKNKIFQTTTYDPNNPANTESITVEDLKYRTNRFAFQNQFIVGTTYQRIFDNWAFEIFGGYEFNLWFNLHEIYRSKQTQPGNPIETRLSNGLLGMQGFTFRATFGF